MRNPLPSWMLIAGFALAVGLPAVVSSSSSVAEHNQKGFLELRMREACKHICIEARTAREVSRCVASQERFQGSTSFHIAQPDCYDALREYEAFLGPEAEPNAPEHRAG